MQSTVFGVSMELNWGITSREHKENHDLDFEPSMFHYVINNLSKLHITKENMNYKYKTQTASKDVFN